MSTTPCEAEIYSKVHKYLDSDNFCSFASVHKRNNYKIKQSQCD